MPTKIWHVKKMLKYNWDASCNERSVLRTFTALILNFDGLHVLTCKKGLIGTLLQLQAEAVSDTTNDYV